MGKPSVIEHMPPLILTFSGIDGAGKSTQIANLRLHLATAGLRVVRLRFWEDVAVFRRLREYMSHALLKGDQGVGSPEKPVQRRDKNIRSGPLTLVRLVLSMFDAAHLAVLVAATRAESADIIIFDRYLYDELVNLAAANSFLRAYCRLLLWLAPRPQIAYLLDAEPEAACLRKPEYPLDFLRQNRENYLAMASLAGMKVIPPLSPAEVQEQVAHVLLNELPLGMLNRVRRCKAGAHTHANTFAD